MRIEGHNNLKPVIVAGVTRLVVYDAYDNPIAVAVEHSHGVYSVATADHKDFNTILQAAGINKSVIVDKLSV